MQIVYIVMAHRFPEQLVRLINRIQAPDTKIIIHLDRKMEKPHVRQIESGLKGFTNIHYLPRIFCGWGDFGSTQVATKAVSFIINEKLPCDYAILLSGQDYPIKSHHELTSFLENGPGNSFLKFTALPNPKWDSGGMDRIQKWYFSLPYINNQLLRRKGIRLLEVLFNTIQPVRKFPSGFLPFGGSQWWGLTHECLEYINHFVNSHSQFVNYFKHTYHASELFYQTLLLNSPMASKIENRSLTYADWERGHPKVLNTEDINRLSASEMFFGRKFNAHKDSRILDWLDENQ